MTEESQLLPMWKKFEMLSNWNDRMSTLRKLTGWRRFLLRLALRWLAGFHLSKNPVPADTGDSVQFFLERLSDFFRYSLEDRRRVADRFPDFVEGRIGPMDIDRELMYHQMGEEANAGLRLVDPAVNPRDEPIPVEREFKFKLAPDADLNEVLKLAARPPVRFRQGYLLAAPDKSIRVRVGEDGAPGRLTIKAPRLDGGRVLARAEYEYTIPRAHALELLEMCGRVLVKDRWKIEMGEFVWEIDVFGGFNAGLVLIEVELPPGVDDLPENLPAWVGRNVTEDDWYTNGRLSKFPYCKWGWPAPDGQLRCFTVGDGEDEEILHFSATKETAKFEAFDEYFPLVMDGPHEVVVAHHPEFDKYAPGPVPDDVLRKAGWFGHCRECYDELDANGRCDNLGCDKTTQPSQQTT